MPQQTTIVVDLDGTPLAKLHGAFPMPAGSSMSFPAPVGDVEVVSSKLVLTGPIVGGYDGTVTVTVNMRKTIPGTATATSWFEYRHCMGGDTVVIETDSSEIAEEVFTATTGRSLDDATNYDSELGYIWSLREGDGPDGQHLVRPVPLDEFLGAKPDGSPRTLWVTQTEVSSILDS